MKIYTEISIAGFEAWSGAVDTLNKIIDAGKCDVLEAVLEEEYPDGLSETALNDILWFEPEWCYEMCGMRTETEIRDELTAARDELDDFNAEFEDMVEEEADAINSNREIAGLNELDADEMEKLRNMIWERDYAENCAELEERIAELERELENF